MPGASRALEIPFGFNFGICPDTVNTSTLLAEYKPGGIRQAVASLYNLLS